LNLIPRLLWKSLGSRQRDQLLFLLPEQDRQAFSALVTGRRLYPASFQGYRCIFVRIPQCGGASVARALFGRDPLRHVPAYWYQVHSPERFDEYFKFAFVRNPWDRLVAVYRYLQSPGTEGRYPEWSRFVQRFASFEEFVSRWINSENVLRGALFVPQHLFLRDRFGMPCLDYIGRFETLADDFVRVSACLSLRARLPQIGRGETPYAACYSAETRERVAQVYARDVELFGYRFDGGWAHTPLLPDRREGL
jgi:hypothetical protein